MPEIARFFGIIIRMYAPDHAPAHFHAYYGDDDAAIGIAQIEVIAGRLPMRARSLVVEWAALHQAELMENWARMRGGQAPRRIRPL